MSNLTHDQLRQHRALVMRLQRDGAPADYIYAKTKLLKEAWALGLSVHWRAIWLIETVTNETWRR